MPQSTTSPGERLPQQDDASEDASSSSSEEEDLVLEGVIIRNPDVSDSDDTSSSSSSSEDEETSPPPSKKAKKATTTIHHNNLPEPTTNKNKKKNNKKKKKKKEAGPEIVQVDFTFCDMHEKYFHGLKTLLTASSPIYAAQSSALSDLMIQNVSVGTVASTDGGQEEDTAFGFASVLNLTTYQDQPCIQALVQACLKACPPDRKKELGIVLSGQTKRPAGLYLHGRMVNLPLELVQVLHQQLVLDMDWAVEHAHPPEVRKSLDFGAFVLLAPTYRETNHKQRTSYFKFFDDEIFASHAEFTYEIKVPKPSWMEEETPYCQVIVMTKTGHRAAMKSLRQMVGGS